MSLRLNKGVSIPTPSTLSYMWNMGSLLGMCLCSQIVTGIFLSFFYVPTLGEAFGSLIYLCEEVWYGWMIRSAHANGASLFFILAYLHVGRGLYFASFTNAYAWTTGVVILLSLMATAFLGYVLPWGQMSFWGATVITNLASSLPWGDDLVVWVWGGYSVGSPTLSRFYSLHFILPMIVGVLGCLHIIFLHAKGSSNPLGLSADSDNVHFHPLFTLNDLVGFSSVFGFFLGIVIFLPDAFMDSDNFVEANPMSTPAHIQPEWYFLFAYAILRSIPSNVGGVVCMVASILLLLLPYILCGSSCGSSMVKSLIFFLFSGSFIFLTWVGSAPAEGGLVVAARLASAFYFASLLLLSAL